jgi:hypothetical protein
MVLLHIPLQLVAFLLVLTNDRAWLITGKNQRSCHCKQLLLDLSVLEVKGTSYSGIRFIHHMFLVP